MLVYCASDDNGSESNVVLQPPPYSSAEVKLTAAVPFTASTTTSSFPVQSNEKTVSGGQKLSSVVPAEGLSITSPLNRGLPVGTSALAAELGKPIASFTVPSAGDVGGDTSAGRQQARAADVVRGVDRSAKPEDGSAPGAQSRQQILVSSVGATSAAEAKPLQSTVSTSGQPVFGGLRSAATGSISAGTPLFAAPAAVSSVTATDSVSSAASAPMILFGKPVSTLSAQTSTASSSETVSSSSPVDSASNLSGTAQTAPALATTTAPNVVNEPASLTSPTAASNVAGGPAAQVSSPVTSETPASTAASGTIATSAAAAVGPSTGTGFGQVDAGSGQPNAAGATTAGLTLFGKPVSTASATSTFSFGQQPAASASASGTGLFGLPAVTSAGTTAFGQPAAATGLFGKPASIGTGIFGQPAAATSNSGFSQPAFGQQSTSSGTGLFGQPASTASSSSVFGQAASTTPALFGQPTSNTPSAQQTSSGVFGQPSVPASSSGGFGFGQSSGFGSTQTPAFGQSTFGQPSGKYVSL